MKTLTGPATVDYFPLTEWKSMMKAKKPGAGRPGELGAECSCFLATATCNGREGVMFPHLTVPTLPVI